MPASPALTAGVRPRAAHGAERRSLDARVMSRIGAAGGDVAHAHTAVAIAAWQQDRSTAIPGPLPALNPLAPGANPSEKASATNEAFPAETHRHLVTPSRRTGEALVPCSEGSPGGTLPSPRRLRTGRQILLAGRSTWSRDPRGRAQACCKCL